MRSNGKPVNRWLLVTALALSVSVLGTVATARTLSGADAASIKPGMTSQEVQQALGSPRVGRSRDGSQTYTYKFEDRALVPRYRELYVYIDRASGKVIRVESGTDPDRDVPGN